MVKGAGNGAFLFLGENVRVFLTKLYFKRKKSAISGGFLRFFLDLVYYI